MDKKMIFCKRCGREHSWDAFSPTEKKNGEADCFCGQYFNLEDGVQTWYYEGQKPGENLIILRGIPGSGKTTFANYITYGSKKCIHCVEADHFFYDDMVMDGRKYTYIPENISYAHLYAKRMMNAHLVQGRDVIVSNTFTRKWEIESYLSTIPEQIKKNLKITILICSGDYGSLHGVPENTMKEMKERFEY